MSVCLLLSLSLGAMTLAKADVVYSSIPSPLPGNVSSFAYEATSSSEIGNAVTLAAGPRHLSYITVVMSDWAKRSDWLSVGTEAGYNVPLTLNLYNYGTGGAVGSQFATLTTDALIPWRPETDTACIGNDGYQVGTDCYHGIAAKVKFDFSLLNIQLPDTLIFGLALNTADYGYIPTHTPGPYNSLNFGTEGGPTVGSNVYPAGGYVNSTWASAYTAEFSAGDGGTLGVFRLGTSGWDGLSPQIQIEATPEPTSIILFGTLLLGVAGLLKRKVV